MRWIIFILPMLFVRCGNVNKEQSVTDADSLVADSTLVMSEPVDSVVAEEISAPADSADLTTSLERERANAVTEEAQYYHVTITTSQYESSSNVTWHFDKNITPRYFSETWSMEGNEGSSEIMLKDGEVICAIESEPNYEIKWCDKNGGIKTTWDENTGDATDEPIEEDMSGKFTRQHNDNLNTLKAILKEAKITEETSDGYVLRIEQTIDVGQEVTESTEIDIPKAVYKFLMN